MKKLFTIILILGLMSTACSKSCQQTGKSMDQGVQKTGEKIDQGLKATGDGIQKGLDVTGDKVKEVTTTNPTPPAK